MGFGVDGGNSDFRVLHREFRGIVAINDYLGYGLGIWFSMRSRCSRWIHSLTDADASLAHLIGFRYLSTAVGVVYCCF